MVKLTFVNYVNEMCDYNSANAKIVQKAAWTFFDWEKSFQNLSVDRKIDPLNETLEKIFNYNLQQFSSYNPNQKINLTNFKIHE